VKTITLIGAGRLATSLGHLWQHAHVLGIRDVLGRSAAASERAVAAIGAGRAVNDYAMLGPADLFLIATPDGAIARATDELLATGLIDAGSVVFHCSGAESSGLLSAARDRGAAVASAHPLTSFTGIVPPGRFAGVVCAIEGDLGATRVVSDLFSAIGGRPITLETAQKILYHAAAVFGSNYLVTLVQVALDTLGLAGIEPAVGLAMLAPLLRQTVDGVCAHGPHAALTGPIARGDAALVVRQYAALEAADAPIAALYRTLARRTAILADRADPLAEVRRL
jgi:predicted short-subunit dehydrogenase-like oxidoreductase (DUF2520 family)